MRVPTEVEARFAADGRVRVLNFTWQGRKVPVTSQGRQWAAADGRHVLVTAPGERVFELVVGHAGKWEVREGGGRGVA